MRLVGGNISSNFARVCGKRISSNQTHPIEWEKMKYVLYDERMWKICYMLVRLIVNNKNLILCSNIRDSLMLGIVFL